MKRRHRHALAVAAAILVAAIVPGMAQAQSQSPWQFRVALYGYLPDVASKSSFPTGRFTPNIEVDASDILKLQGAFMGTFEAQYLQWGLWTDYMYVNIGADKSGTRSLSIGNAGLPAGVSADLHYNVKGSVWTIAGTYRVLSNAGSTFDVLAGARMVDLRETLDWNFSADLGPSQPARSGNSSDKAKNWDGIIGVKRRVALGPERSWYVPYYLDAGAAIPISRGRAWPASVTPFHGATWRSRGATSTITSAAAHPSRTRSSAGRSSASLSAGSGTTRSPAGRAWIARAVCTGLRRSELHALRHACLTCAKQVAACGVSRRSSSRRRTGRASRCLRSCARRRLSRNRRCGNGCRPA